jgi:hypothetical protein
MRRVGLIGAAQAAISPGEILFKSVAFSGQANPIAAG